MITNEMLTLFSFQEIIQDLELEQSHQLQHCLMRDPSITMAARIQGRFKEFGGPKQNGLGGPPTTTARRHPWTTAKKPMPHHPTPPPPKAYRNHSIDTLLKFNHTLYQ